MHVASRWNPIGFEAAIMLSKTMTFWAWFLLSMLVTLAAGLEAIAQDSGWRVSKSSGEVWVVTPGAQPAALTSDAVLTPGATIRTGENGRALVVRGADTMLISGSSVVSIPGDTKEGSWTRILHQAGSVLLNVEKRKVQHFEVSTPYLAAVVKGTQFRVTVGDHGGNVDVLRGEVEVTDYKSGQYALVRSSQAARVSLQGPVGLSLSGSGRLSPIQQGAPGGSSVTPITIPGERASAPAPSERTSAAEPTERTSTPDRTQTEPSTPMLERHARQAPAPS